MSNVIKAATITYTQEKRKIDSNKKAAEFTRLFVEKHAVVKDDAQEAAAKEADGFKEGLGAFVKSASSGEEPASPLEEEPNIEELRKQFLEEMELLKEETRQETSQMLLQAEADADRIRKQAHEAGSRQGYEEGSRKAEVELSRIKKELEIQEEENRREYERQVEELEPAFVEMVIRLVKKLTGVLLEDKGNIVLYLLEQSMCGIEPSMTYLIHVSPDDFDIVEEKKQDLIWKIKEGASLEVIEDRTLKQGQCMIETDSRIFDCGIDTQFKNLTSDLRLLAGLPEME